MDNRFKEKLELNALIESYQDEIDKLLIASPELGDLQRDLEVQLDKIGDVRTVEGRMNRSALMFSLLQESFLKFNEGLEEYKQALTADLESKKRKTKLTVI